MRTGHDLHVLDDPDALSRAVAAHWLSVADDARTNRGGFHVALAGGSTPRMLYELMASGDFRDNTDWRTTHIYFGDERCVPPDHHDSNYRMALETLLRHVDIPAGQIHRIEAERTDRDAAARDYAQILEHRLPTSGDRGPPCFDLVLLGLGADGHIASLFPGTDALDERRRLVVPVRVDSTGTWRISLTFPVINVARHIAIMVAGEAKADIVGEVLNNSRDEPRYPVECLAPRGRLAWFVDRAAAARLPGGGLT